MRLIFTESAWDDYQWIQSRNRQLLKRVNALIKDVLRSPFDGIGNRNDSKQTYLGTGRVESMTSFDWFTLRRATMY